MPFSIAMFVVCGLVCQQCNSALFFDTHSSCPKSCDCNLPWFMNGAFVDCSARDLSAAPAAYPQNTVELDLSANRLERVPYLKTLHRLKKLDVSRNRLEDAGVESMADLMCDLEELVLAKNQITRFPAGLPKSLTYLDLCENVISSLTCSLLTILPPVQSLILCKNMLSVLTKDSFCPNYGASPPLSAVLRHLDLSGNNIHVLEDGVFRCLTQLERLNLSANLISIVGPKEFKGLTTLNILDLSNNALLQVGEGTFNDMTSLYYLNLRRNQLTSPPRRLVPSIYVLDVSSNAIAVIAEDGSLFDVRHILIGHNPLICDCRIRWIREHLIGSIPVSLRKEDCPVDIPIPKNDVLLKELAPRCANPPSLAGKPLAQVDEDRLVCCADNNHTCRCFGGKEKHVACRSQRPINRIATMPRHTSSKSIAELFQNRHCECPNLPENPWAHVHHNNRSNLVVEWTIPSALEGTTVEVRIHKFGFKHCKMVKKVPIADKRVMLSDLSADTNYVVCVMPTHCVNSETPVLLDSCFEVRTAQMPWFYKLTAALVGSCTCAKRYLCTIILFLILLGVGLMLGHMKQLVTRQTKILPCI